MLKNRIKKWLFCSLVLLFTIGGFLPGFSQISYAEEPQVNSTVETITLDPSYQHEPFDGWGTALVWFANVTGGWPDEIRNQLANDLFGEEGLNFNIARYNIGGGDSPDTTPYMRKGGAVPGYWNRPSEFGPPDENSETWTEQENWWDPQNENHWNWEADANQRWWLEAAKARGADTFEAFSNSPPYFMTQSGYTSGNWNSWDDNIKPDQFENFATYLTTVVDRLQKDLDIEFKTLSPVNEPYTGYWKALGRQEGSNWSRASQAKIINEVKKQLDEKQLNTVVSAMDETNPQKFRENWEQYNSETRLSIGQLNVHTYWPEQQIGVRDIAKASGKRLWMSEVDLSPGGGQDHGDIRTGLGLSERITTDIQKLEPKAWVLWQAIEDEVNMSPEHENGNWGLIQVDFSPKDFNTIEIYKNKKYYAMGNYSKFIRPGYQVINTNSSQTVAAIHKQDESLVIVYTNHSTEEKTVEFDLSGFETVGENAKAVPYITSATDNLAKGSAVNVSNKTLTTKIKPQSITTFVVSNVSGVDLSKEFIHSTENFKVINKNSGKVISVGADSQKVVQKTNDRDNESQNWKITQLTDGNSSKEVYKIIHSESGKVLDITNGSATLQENEENSLSQQWMLSTYGNGEYTLINMKDGNLLEVGGQSKEEDAGIGVWKPNTGNNQIWKIIKAGIVKIEPVEEIVTKKQIAPVLPGEVTAVYGDGSKAQKEVVWNAIDPELYKKENTFTVEGKVEGTDLKAIATVTVSKVDSSEPIKMKTVKGVAPNLPKEIKAELKSGTSGMVEVEWEEIDPSLYKEVSKFTVRGKIVNSPKKALAYVQVTEPALENIALKNSNSDYPKANASFTGQWDSVNAIHDGNISSVRWTNWDPNSWREEDWVSIKFENEKKVSEVTYHFYDDQGGTRPAESLKLQYWDGSDWKDIEGTQSDVQEKTELHLSFTEVSTTAIRAVMKAIPNTCIAISELKIWGEPFETFKPSIGTDATLEKIFIDGKSLKNFDSDTFTYTVKVNKNQSKNKKNEIQAVTNDLFASTKIKMPDTIPGQAKIIVTSEDLKTVNTYQIEFVEKN